MGFLDKLFQATNPHQKEHSVSPTFSPEEIEAIRAIVPWIKIQTGGFAGLLVLTIWRAFKLYGRLTAVEKTLSDMGLQGFLTEKSHEKIAERCRVGVSSEIAEKTNALHLILLDEISEIKGTQCKMLGTLEQIGSLLQSLLNASIQDNRRPPPPPIL